MTAQHTAGKLQTGKTRGFSWQGVTDEHGLIVCQVVGDPVEREANALELVRRWNAFLAMLEALKRIAEGMVMGGRSDFTAIDVMLAYQDLARAALKAGTPSARPIQEYLEGMMVK